MPRSTKPAVLGTCWATANETLPEPHRLTTVEFDSYENFIMLIKVDAQLIHLLSSNPNIRLPDAGQQVSFVFVSIFAPEKFAKGRISSEFDPDTLAGMIWSECETQKTCRRPNPGQAEYSEPVRTR